MKKGKKVYYILGDTDPIRVFRISEYEKIEHNVRPRNCPSNEKVSREYKTKHIL